MNDKERLIQWMEKNAYDYRSLAIATGDTRSSVHQMTIGDREVNQAFKWRFGLAFGFEVAKEIFVEQPLEDEATLAPVAR